MLDKNHVASKHKANPGHPSRKRPITSNTPWTYLLLFSLVLLIVQGCGTTDSDSGFMLNVTVSPEEAGEVSPRSGAYDQGSEVELTVTPADGWIFTGWEGDISGEEYPVTLLMDSDKNVTALFTRRQYDLSLEIEGEGRVREEVVEAAKAEYDHGTTVQLTAEPFEGWEFVGWKGDLEGSENPQTIVIDQPKQVTAVFEPNEVTISTSVTSGEGEIRIEPEKDVYLIGDEITVTAVAGERYRFAAWGGDFAEEDESFTIESLEGDISLTVEFTEALLPLWAMGYNHNGQLGDGTRESRSTPVQGGASFFDVENVAAGAFHSLILSTSGELLGMGYNGHGQLGIGSTADQVNPVSIAENVSSMSAGENHSLFIRDGNLWAMGANQYGQLGDGTTTEHSSPVEVYAGVEQAVAGDWHSLFITTNGELWGMGNSARGQLGFISEAPEGEDPGDGGGAPGDGDGGEDPGDGDSEPGDGEEPGDGDGEPGDGEEPGDGDGDGEPGDGEPGDGDGDGDGGGTPAPVIVPNADPVRVDHGVTVTQVAAGGFHTLFIDADGTLWGLGSNTYGQLGDHPRGDYDEPVEVARNVDRVTAGRNHTMYISNGDLYVVGNNLKGQLGIGSENESQFEPVQIASGVEYIAAGLYHSLYITSDGTLYGMGENDPQGQLGIEGPDQLSPVEIDTNVRRIAAGVRHSLFIKDIQ